jgi:predicted nicotinamide N-methyase
MLNLENRCMNMNETQPKFLSDEKLQLITGQIFIGQAILVAYQLGLFKLLCVRPLSIQQIATHMGLHERAVQAMISCSSTLNLVEYQSDGYQLSQQGKMYLDEDSPEYYGKVLDLLIQEHEIMTFPSIKNALLSNKPRMNEEKELFANSNSLSSTELFIASLHHKAFKPAFYWPKTVDLNNYKTFVDIGGGSGIHTIAACLNNPAICGVVCDRPGVIPYTQKYIKDFDLETRIIPTALDIWKDPFPEGDVYFLADILHDWERAKCLFLVKKCFQHLPKNGQIILHEMLFNEDKTGPLLTAAYNMKMIVWTEGQQFSSAEIEDILKEAGFLEVFIKKSLGNWSIITGIKR